MLFSLADRSTECQICFVSLLLSMVFPIFCAEQYLMVSKCRVYGDAFTEMKILQETCDPHSVRKIGKTVLGFKSDPARWYKVAKSFMFKANFAKYSQDPGLAHLSPANW